MSSGSGPSVLFLSANAGTGHTMAAEAVKQSLQELDPSISCEIVNSYKYLNLILEKLMQDGYLHLVRLLPKVYGYLYDRKNKKRSIRGIKDWLNKVSAGNFKKMIEEKQPDVIVCTHAFPCGVLSYIRQHFGLDHKIMGVVTDFVISPFWIYPETDMYMVAASDLKKDLIARGVQSSKVVASGIPINPKFYEEISKTDLRNKLDLSSDLPLVLVMGGGLGMSPVTGIIRTLKKITVPYQAVVITGTNEKMKRKLDDTLSKLPNVRGRVKILGFVDNIYEYMKAADLLVTKPGGMTAAEAISIGLPMIITSPIPGQEIRNAKYLVEKGISICINDEKELPAAIEEFLKSKSQQKKMSKKANAIASPNAAGEVARQIYKMINQKQPEG
ncbi:MAG: glycosyltransferase [Firmicutes bacterium]|nr:glycosyltransferase [Bacillota bacterium]